MQVLTSSYATLSIINRKKQIDYIYKLYITIGMHANLLIAYTKN